MAQHKSSLLKTILVEGLARNPQRTLVGIATLALVSVTWPTACHHKTAVSRSSGADSGGTDVAASTGNPGVVPDASSMEVASSGPVDAGPALGIPKGFRIVNATSNPAYVDLGDAVKCRTQDVYGWQACEFFRLWCFASCQSIQPGDQCCAYCEQEVPSVQAVPAGGSRTIAWTGSLFATRADYCSDCKCQEQSAVEPGTFEAMVRAYDQYNCVWGQPCAEKPEGVIEYAAPQGSYQDHAVQFPIPSPDNLIVITIPAELSVQQVIRTADTLIDAQFVVVGKVSPDIRQKPGNWPDPALSPFLLQDEGAACFKSADMTCVQLYATNDLSPYLEQPVRVTAYLRRIMVQDTFGTTSAPMTYLEVVSITAL